MAQNDHPLKRLLAEQRRRCVATILGSCEGSSWWGKLSRDEQLDLREDVLHAVGALYDVSLDVVKVSDDGSVSNGLVLDLLQQIHGAVLKKA